VYGEVPLSTLTAGDGDQGGTYSTPSAAFTYSMATDWFSEGTSSSTTMFSVPAAANDCDSVHASFVAGMNSNEWSTHEGDSGSRDRGALSRARPLNDVGGPSLPGRSGGPASSVSAAELSRRA
jgi:hypothetical protein